MGYIFTWAPVEGEDEGENRTVRSGRWRRGRPVPGSGGGNAHPYFPGEETEAQRGCSPTPGLHSTLAVGQDLRPHLSGGTLDLCVALLLLVLGVWGQEQWAAGNAGAFTAEPPGTSRPGTPSGCPVPLHACLRLNLQAWFSCSLVLLVGGDCRPHPPGTVPTAGLEFRAGRMEVPYPVLHGGYTPSAHVTAVITAPRENRVSSDPSSH